MAGQSVQQTFEKVKEYLLDMFGSKSIIPLEDNGFWLRHGSTVVFVFVLPFSSDEQDRSIVNVWSRVTVGTPLSSELAVFLIKENARFRFGAFRYYEDQESPSNSSVIFEYNLLGEAITKQFLFDAVVAVAGTSDSYDEQIASRFGGKTVQQIAQEELGDDEDEEWE